MMRILLLLFCLQINANPSCKCLQGGTECSCYTCVCQDDYSLKYKQAVEQNRYLIVWVNNNHNQFESKFPKHLHCHIQSFPNMKDGIAICVPRNKELWVIGRLSKEASYEEILDIISPKEIKQAYIPMFQVRRSRSC